MNAATAIIGLAAGGMRGLLPFGATKPHSQTTTNQILPAKTILGGERFTRGDFTRGPSTLWRP